IAVVTVDLLFAAPAKFLLHTELPQPRLPVAGRADADEPRRRTRFLPPVSLGANSRPRPPQRASGQRVQRLLQEAAAVGRVEQDEIEAPSPLGQIPQRAPDMSAPDLRPLLPRLRPHPRPQTMEERGAHPLRRGTHPTPLPDPAHGSTHQYQTGVGEACPHRLAQPGVLGPPQPWILLHNLRRHVPRFL